MKLIKLLPLILASSLYANDCIPLTFKSLSIAKGTPVAYSVWTNTLMPDGKTPTLEAAILSWNKQIKSSSLVCVYTVMSMVETEDLPIVYDSSYLWIGLVDPKMAADPSSTDDAHAAILYILKDHRYKLYHTLDPKGEKFFIEYLSEKDFFSRTFAVFKVVTKKS